MRFLLAIVTLVAIPIGIGFILFQQASEESSAAQLHGAIFTTTPDGGIVNENVRYQQEIEVYLDGGPPPNAPQTAAGLPKGDYVFQVTDPSGKVLLSEDPARCRVFRVQDGIIVALRDEADGAFEDHGEDDDCHVNDPDGEAGATGEHDTNVDVDHGADGAIVVQLMPFFDTPNPGGVYKAWVIPLGRYLEPDGGVLDADPEPLCTRKGRPSKNCNGNAVQIGFERDPGFGPPRNQVKTDNFKVREAPPVLQVLKFHDVNANGQRDDGEPWISGDPTTSPRECVEPHGTWDPACLGDGGWLIHITETLFDGTAVTMDRYTPVWQPVAPGEVMVEEDLYPGSGWVQSHLSVDGDQFPTAPSVSVTFVGNADEHTVIFGNFLPAQVQGQKFIDLNANGKKDPGEGCPPAPDVNNPGCEGVTIRLHGVDGTGSEVDEQTVTDHEGRYSFTGLRPGTYTITLDEPDGFICSFPGPDPDCTYEGLALESGDTAEDLDFGDFSLGEIHGVKFFDRNGNGVRGGGEDGIPDVEIHLDGTDGMGNEVHLVTWTCGGTNAPDCMGEEQGAYWFTDLVPGDYDVTEVVPDGFVRIAPGGDGEHDVNLTSDEICTDKDFANFGPCDGLTPGYWSNWRNHYTEAQFTTLLGGTIASSIEEADGFLDSVGCDGDDALHCMRRFLLANQLTLNLTQQSGLPNPDGAGLVGLCSIEGIGTLQGAINDALDILADPGGFDRDQILAVKNRLAAFAELNSAGPAASPISDIQGPDSTQLEASEPSGSDPVPPDSGEGDIPPAPEESDPTNGDGGSDPVPPDSGEGDIPPAPDESDPTSGDGGSDPVPPDSGEGDTSTAPDESDPTSGDGGSPSGDTEADVAEPVTGAIEGTD